MNALILDCVFVFLFFAFVFAGFKTGAVRAFLLLANSIISTFLSVYFSKNLSDFIYNNFMQPAIINQVKTLSFENKLNYENIFCIFPLSAIKHLIPHGINMNKINHIINNIAVADLPYSISQMIKPMVTGILRSVLAIFLFVVLMFLGKIFVNMVSRIVRLGRVGKINGFVGGLFGALKGYMVLSVFMCCVKILIPFSENSSVESFLNNDLPQSTVFKYVYDNNPVYVLFKKI